MTRAVKERSSPQENSHDLDEIDLVHAVLRLLEQEPAVHRTDVLNGTLEALFYNNVNNVK